MSTRAKRRLEAGRSGAGDFLAEHFELEPLFLGGGDLPMQFAEFAAEASEARAIAAVEIRIGELDL